MYMLSFDLIWFDLHTSVGNYFTQYYIFITENLYSLHGWLVGYCWGRLGEGI